MIIWQHSLEIHVGCPDFLPVYRQDPIVKDLFFWDNSLVSHSVQCPAFGQDNFTLCLAFRWFNPCGVPINFMQYNLIFIPPDQYVRELPFLVCVEFFLGFVYCEEKIAPLLLWTQLGLTAQLRLLLGSYFGGLHSLPLIFHMNLLGFFRFWEVLADIFHCNQWPGQVVPFADAFDTHGFG